MPEANCAIRYSSKAIIFAKRSLIRPGGHWWAVKAYPILSDSHFSQKSFIQGPRVSLNQEFQQNVAMFVYMYSGNFILSNTMRPKFLWSNFEIFHFPAIWGGILWVWIRSKLEFLLITGEIVLAKIFQFLNQCFVRLRFWKKCLKFMKPTCWINSCFAGDTFLRPKLCKTLI